MGRFAISMARGSLRGLPNGGARDGRQAEAAPARPN